MILGNPCKLIAGSHGNLLAVFVKQINGPIAVLNGLIGAFNAVFLCHSLVEEHCPSVFIVIKADIAGQHENSVCKRIIAHWVLIPVILIEPEPALAVIVLCIDFLEIIEITFFQGRSYRKSSACDNIERHIALGAKLGIGNYAVLRIINHFNRNAILWFEPARTLDNSMAHNIAEILFAPDFIVTNVGSGIFLVVRGSPCKGCIPFFFGEPATGIFGFADSLACFADWCSRLIALWLVSGLRICVVVVTCHKRCGEHNHNKQQSIKLFHYNPPKKVFL